MRILALIVIGAALLPGCSLRPEQSQSVDPVSRNVLLPPKPGNPRNSEGDFIRLKDGRMLFVYTHFTGGSGDHATGHLAGRYSDDGGVTWSKEDVVIVPNEGGLNVMSVSLLRLHDGRIALFYLRKNSLTDCRPMMRVSTDEAKTWKDPVLCIPDGEKGYYVLNNDRAVQLKNGRLVLPVALHNTPAQNKFHESAIIMNYLSDDNGQTWRRSKTQREAKTADGKNAISQEPGVVELKDGRLMIYCRTAGGSQFVAFSDDKGDTFSPFQATNILSPLSPASIERIPGTGDLIMVWNNSNDTSKRKGGVRTPLNVAISKDEGKTWQNVKTLEADPDGWYCYTAIDFVGKHVLLAHCAGSQSRKTTLDVTQITRFPISWLYKASE